MALWWRGSILSFFARIIERALDPQTLIRLADGLDVVPMLVSHFDSCFTIRLVDLWALYIFLFPYIQNSEESYIHSAAIHQICAFISEAICNVAM